MRLRKRQEYQRMLHGTFKYTGQWILIDLRPTSHLFSRLGLTVTRRYGGACQRNRFKRLMREAFRLSHSNFPFTIDLVVRPRSQATTAHLADLQQELKAFIQQAYQQRLKNGFVQI